MPASVLSGELVPGQGGKVTWASDLYMQIEAASNHHGNSTKDGSGPSSRTEAARDAGFSQRQQAANLHLDIPLSERASDLYMQIEPGQGARDGKRGVGGHTPFTREDAASDTLMRPSSTARVISSGANSCTFFASLRLRSETLSKPAASRCDIGADGAANSERGRVGKFADAPLC